MDSGWVTVLLSSVVVQLLGCVWFFETPWSSVSSAKSGQNEAPAPHIVPLWGCLSWKSLLPGEPLWHPWLSTRTMCPWHGRISELIQPLSDSMLPPLLCPAGAGCPVHCGLWLRGGECGDQLGGAGWGHSLATGSWNELYPLELFAHLWPAFLLSWLSIG